MTKFIFVFFIFLNISSSFKAAPVTSMVSLETLISNLENSLRSTTLSAQERHHLYSILGELTLCRGVIESLPLAPGGDVPASSGSFLDHIVHQMTQLQEDLRHTIKETSPDSKDFEQKTLLLGTLHLCKPSLKGAALLENKMNQQSSAAPAARETQPDQIK